ncbi:hypothetical protein [Asanoa hainanensis]|uniref:hypothetical protein n=1 Tax=Asanoa hainanensis TaxID=560556 RepID=UPI0011810393|nr:hypothetical protein [Asanoa hainanensis]
MLEIVLWGLAGSFVVEALNFVGSIRKHQSWPWRAPGELNLWLYSVCSLLRLLVGAIVAGALGADGQVSGTAGAFLIGVSAPLIVQRVVQQAEAKIVTPLDQPETERAAVLAETTGGADANVT